MIRDDLDQYMRPIASPIAKPSGRVLQIDQMNNFQYQPLGEPNTTAKGTFILYDKTGGTALFKYDPKTGVITILGSFIANNVNSGTYSNIVFSGTNTLTGTIAQGVLMNTLFTVGTVGTSLVQGGTVNNSNVVGGTINGTTYSVGGTPGTTTNFIYVKTITPGTTYGTLFATNGLITSIT